MRKLASIRKIKEIQPIENADRIEIAVIDGWKVVTKKEEYKADDTCVYCEIDSWIPHELAPFLSKDKPREYEGVKDDEIQGSNITRISFADKCASRRC
jgi:RNA ligase (TIGR02306 family)